MLFTFIVLSIINVIGSTIRSLTTINSGKTVASLVSGAYFAFYNVVLVATVADFPMWQKCIITFACNVIGVYVVKLVEQKMRKDRLWKIEISYKGLKMNEILQFLRENNLSFDYINIKNGYYRINVYAKTQKESKIVANMVKNYNCKYFITENRGDLCV